MVVNAYTYTHDAIIDDWNSLDYPEITSSLSKSQLPTDVDLTEQFPTPGDQGDSPCCSSWAVGYYLYSSMAYTKWNWTKDSQNHLFSPLFVYNLTNSGLKKSTTVNASIEAIKNIGICTLSYLPYDENNDIFIPTSLQFANASLYKAVDGLKISDIGAMKDKLANGVGVVLSIVLYEDFNDISQSNPIYDTISGEILGNHAICLIGYDDSINAFKFINSYGTDWGLDGYGWISYDLVNSDVVNLYKAGHGYGLNFYSFDNYLLGDVNEDGSITAADARLVLRYSARTETPTDMQFVLGDVDGDGQITASDARSLLNYASKTIDKLPLYE